MIDYDIALEKGRVAQYSKIGNVGNITLYGQCKRSHDTNIRSTLIYLNILYDNKEH